MSITYKKTPNTEKQLNRILHPIVKTWFFSRFKSFSLPQLYGVMEIHSRNNVLVSAPTGATKTLTSFLSILNELVDSSRKEILEDKIYAVYISPLKALNEDIKVNLIEPLKQMQKISKEHFDFKRDLGIRVGVRTGDTTQYQRQKMLKNPPHILITTPESIALMLSSPKASELLNDVQWCILDEIHSIAENKRGVHLSLSMERLQRKSPAMTRIGLSATVAPIKEVAKYLVGSIRNCKIIDVQFLKELDMQVLSPVYDFIETDFKQISKRTYELVNQLIQKHKTTLIFTNTRAGTERVVHHLKDKFPEVYYEVNEKPPHKRSSLIGAHHGSLSKEHRFKIEDSLRKDKLKAVVCSTSLELGIDIGTIDLVILLGSPKSVARALQRAGRAGHKLHAITKARMIVMNRDDLLECSVLLKNAVEKKIDRIHIPTNCLDVLAQQILGIAVDKPITEKELFDMIIQSYCYKDLNYRDYQQILEYLAGEYVSLEDRNVYAKIWRKNDTIGGRGFMPRILYMTNIGTIPSQGGIVVKRGQQILGKIDEAFLERLKKGDRFVLGGEVYEFKHARGMVAQVRDAGGKKPTVPSWISESLPLSFDLATSIQHFRSLVKDKFENQVSKTELLEFIQKYLYVDELATHAIFNFLKSQQDYIGIPSEKELMIEHYYDEEKHYYLFHAMFGRRVNDALSRTIAFAVARINHKDVEVGINDHGFYLAALKPFNIEKAINELIKQDFKKVLKNAIEKTEVLKRRFRNCAQRSLMILRNYKGRTKSIGRQQVSSKILLSAVKRIDENFVILKEARREVMEDLMDVDNAMKIIDDLNKKKIKIKKIETNVPSPFATQLLMQGLSDILTAQDRQEFLKMMHQHVMAKIALKKGKRND